MTIDIDKLTEAEQIDFTQQAARWISLAGMEEKARQ